MQNAIGKIKNIIIKRRDPLVYGCALAVLFTLFLLVNLVTPMMGEDYALRTYTYSTGPENLPSFFADVFQRILEQSRGWNVRLGEQLSILFGSMHPLVFKIGNSAVAVMFIHLVCLYAFPDKKIDYKKAVFSAVISFSLIFALQPIIGEMFFWRTGSANYLWAIVILLWFSLPIYYLFHDVNRFEDKSVALPIIHTIVGFFAGFTTENAVIGTIALYVFVTLYLALIKKERIKAWVYTSFVSLMLGYTYLVTAPSTAHRIDYYSTVNGVNPNPGIVDMFRRLPSVIGSFVRVNYGYFVALCALLFSLLLFCCVLRVKRQAPILQVRQQEDRLHINLPIASVKIVVVSLIAFLSVIALVASPYIESRAFFCYSLFMLVLIVHGLFKIKDFLKLRMAAAVVAALLFACAGGYNYAQIYSAYYDYNAFTVQRADYLINAAMDDQVSSATYPLYESNHFGRILVPEGWITSSTGSGNASFAGFYGLESVEFVPASTER